MITDRRLFTDRDLEALLETLFSGVPAGTLAIQVREKDLPARPLFELTRRIIAVARPYDVPVLVNDRLDVAMAAKADGIHLPVSGLPPTKVRAIFSGLVGVSCHSMSDVLSLSPSLVDFATIGPVFETPSKRAYGPPIGLKVVTEAAKHSKVPLFGIGGITPQNAQLLRGTGVRGVAAISAVWTAQDPAKVIREVLRALEDEPNPQR